jgi:V8-like Glu-specific endopeptidase
MPELPSVGSDEPPSDLTKVYGRQPSITRKSPPENFFELARRESIYISADEEPKTEISQVEGEPFYRLSIPQTDDQSSTHPPLKSADRKKPSFFLEEVDDSLSITSSRPDWVNAMYSPRLSHQQGPKDFTRMDGTPYEPHRVFGSDDRNPYKETAWPWGAVGKVERGDGIEGTGVLIGENLVATAGHVVPWDKSTWMKFTPAYYNGNSLHGKGVESYVSRAKGYDVSGIFEEVWTGEVAGYDWAILQIRDPLGSYLGYMGSNGYSSDWNGSPYWTIAGYPGDVSSGEKPFFQSGVTIFDVDSDLNGGREMETKTGDVSDGNSGSPMFAWWGEDVRIIGVVSGEEEDYDFPFSTTWGNVIAGGAGLHSLISWGRSNW